MLPSGFHGIRCKFNIISANYAIYHFVHIGPGLHIACVSYSRAFLFWTWEDGTTASTVINRSLIPQLQEEDILEGVTIRG